MTLCSVQRSNALLHQGSAAFFSLLLVFLLFFLLFPLAASPSSFSDTSLLPPLTGVLTPLATDMAAGLAALELSASEVCSDEASFLDLFFSFLAFLLGSGV